jgi:acyl carrier protein
MSITTQQAHDMLARHICLIAPDADLEGLAPDADLRRTFELDSLDFLELVERLSKDAGVRIDEEDYPALRTMESWEAFLVARTAALG